MAISPFFDPKNDYVFWKISATETDKDAIITFLNDVLCLEGSNQIIDVTFLDPTHEQSIADVLCTDQNGVQIKVQIQDSRHPAFENPQHIIKEDDDEHKKIKLKTVIVQAIADYVSDNGSLRIKLRKVPQ